MVSTRLEARYNPMIGFLPQLGLAAVLLIGGTSVIHAHLSLGQFTAFYFYLNMLIAPMRSLGVTLGLAQRATASGARIFQVLDREPRLTSPPDAPPLPAGNGHVELRGVTLRYDEADDFGAAYRSEEGGRARSGRRLARRPGRLKRARGVQRRATFPRLGIERAAPGRRRRSRRRPCCSATRGPRRGGGPNGRAGGSDRLGQDQPRVAHLAAV